MYKLLGIFLILASVALGGYSYWQSGTEAAGTIQTPTKSGLVGYWSFEEATGTKATDFSGNGNTGTLTSMANPATATSGWGTGRLGAGLNFDGTNDYVNIPNTAFAGQFSFSMWFKIPNDSGQTFFGDVNGTIGGGPKIGLASNAFFVRVVSSSDNSIALPTANVWHYFTITRDASDKIDLYVDGGNANRLFANAAQTGTFTLDKLAANGDASQTLRGSLDEVRVYNRTLTQAEIIKLYQAGAAKINASQNSNTTSGLVGEWSFNGPDVTDKVYDRSGQGNNGYFIGGATSSAKVIGKVGQALTFDGVNDYVSTNQLDLGLVAATQGAVCAWSKPTRAHNSSAIDWIINKTSVGAIEFQMGHYSDNFLYFGFVGNGRVAFPATASKWPPGVWTFYCTTYGNSIVTAFINGVAIATSTFNSISPGAKIQIGAQNLTNFYRGTIDEVRVYNRTLSAAEIAKLYQSGNAIINASQNSNTTSGLIGEWSFNGSDVTDKVYDRSGQGNNGYFIGGATSSAKVIGKVGQALTFDGVNDYVSTATTMNFGGTKIITVSFWYKKAIAWTNDDHLVMELTSNFNVNDGTFIVDPNAANGFFSLFIQDSIATSKYRQESFTRPSIGEWHHYAFIFDNSTVTGDIVAYVDGVEKSTVLGTNTKDQSTAIKTDTLYFMTRGGTSLFSEGALDEVRVYNRTLSATEVAQLYNMGR